MASRDLLCDPRTIKLRRILGIELWMAFGLLHSLWHWCSKYAANGVIDADPADFAEGIGYSGDPAALFAALEEAGWLAQEGRGYAVVDAEVYGSNAWKAALRRAKSGQPRRTLSNIVQHCATLSNVVEQSSTASNIVEHCSTLSNNVEQSAPQVQNGEASLVENPGLPVTKAGTSRVPVLVTLYKEQGVTNTKKVTSKGDVQVEGGTNNTLPDPSQGEGVVVQGEGDDPAASGPPWHLSLSKDDPARLVAEAVLGAVKADGTPWYALPGQRECAALAERVLDSVGAAAFREVWEPLAAAFADYHRGKRKAPYSQPVLALREWASRREAQWRQNARERKRDAARPGLAAQVAGAVESLSGEEAGAWL